MRGILLRMIRPMKNELKRGPVSLEEKARTKRVRVMSRKRNFRNSGGSRTFTNGFPFSNVYPQEPRSFPLHVGAASAQATLQNSAQPSPLALLLMIFHVLLMLRWNAFGSRSLGKKITSKVPGSLFALRSPDQTHSPSDKWPGNQAGFCQAPILPNPAQLRGQRDNFVQRPGVRY